MHMSTPSLAQYLLSHLSAHPEQQELVSIMNDLSEIGKRISHHTNKAGLTDILGEAGETNATDDAVQKLDVFSNELCKDVLKNNPHIAALASEEEETVVDLQNEGEAGEYIVMFDPLDGSSNIDVNVSVGTIFSIFKKRTDIERTNEAQFFQPGTAQVCAGYVLYGSSTVLVFTFGDGVHEFTLEPNTKDFYLSNERITIPEKCPYYSVNEGKIAQMPEKDQQFVAWLKDEQGCSARYIGSLVADVHRNLVKGGVFLYPTLKEKGKLRLNYELKPMAFLIEQAGGTAVYSGSRIMDEVPTSLHERMGFIAGNTSIIESFYN